VNVIYCVLQLGVDNKTVIDWCNFMRDVCSADLLRNPFQLGGVGHTVAIDESMVARRKPGNIQGRPVPAQWVFGGVDLNTGDFFMELVPRRDAATLLPIIQRNIVAGTCIWSDQWAAYNTLNNIGYVHQTVNHDQHYVDPISGVHTNNIEARWVACKATFKRRYGVHRRHLPSYMDEYTWRAHHSHDHMLPDMLAAIEQQYPV